MFKEYNSSTYRSRCGGQILWWGIVVLFSRLC